MPLFKILASQIGSDAGPFTIKNNLGQVIATGVTRLQLLNGYLINLPTGITSVTVESTGGCTNSTILTVPNAGFWEMEKNNVEEVSDHYGAIQTNYVVPVETFVAKDIIGVYTGVVSGSGIWLIKGTAEAIAGTTYNPNGLLIVTNANTNTATTVEGGAIVQLGYDLNTTKGSFGGTATVNAGGIVNVVGANEPNGRAVFVALTNNGNVSFNGPERCGEGFFTNSAAVTNNGTIAIDNSIWRLGVSLAGTGTVNVADGGTFSNAGLNVPATQSFNINGCGWCNNIGVKQGALLFEGLAYWYAPTTVQTASCIKTSTTGVYFSAPLYGSAPLEVGTTGTPVAGIALFQNQTSTYSGTLTSNGTLVATQLNSLKYATLTAINGGQITSSSGVFKSIYGSDTTSYLTGSGNTYIENNGITQFDGRFLWDGQGSNHNVYLQGGSGNQLTLTAKGSAATMYVQGGSKLTLQGASITGPPNGQVRVLNGSVVSAGTSTDAAIDYLLIDATSSLEVRAVGSGSSVINIVGAGGLNVAAGWKVDLPDAMAAGVYTIIKNSGGAATILPTTGVNNTDKTVSYAWDNTVSPRLLKMTLS